MLTEFIEWSLKKASYELLEEGEWYYGEIPGFEGVWANSDTLEGCRTELKEVLEEWLILKLRKKMFIPKVEQYNLNELVCQN